MKWWNDDEPGELIAVWDSADPLPPPNCFDTLNYPDLVVPPGQHPIEGQFQMGNDVYCARIWIPMYDRTRRFPIEISVHQFALEFDGKEDSPVRLLPDLEFYDEWVGNEGEGMYIEGIRRIDFGQRVERRRRPLSSENEDDDE